jgi:hypothetical protein
VIPEWFKKPEVIYSTILFLLATGISVYSSVYPSKVKGLLHLPGKKMRESTIRRLEGELSVLNALNNDSYRLLLWAIWNVLNVMNFVVWSQIASGSLNLIGYFITGKWLWTGVSPLIFSALGAALGRFGVAYRIVNGLLKIDERKAELEKDIATMREQYKVNVEPPETRNPQPPSGS